MKLHKMNDIILKRSYMTRTRNTYSKEFKGQMISLIEGGKPRIEVINEYELRPSTLDR